MTRFARLDTFNDLDAFVASIERAGGDIIPMAGGPWRATLATVRMGAVQLYRADVPPQIRQGAAAPGEIVMGTRAPAGALRHLGRELEPGDVCILADGAPVDTLFRRPAIWTGVQFAPGALAGLAEGWAPRLPSPGRHAFLRLAPPEQDRLLAAVEATIDEGIRAPALLAHEAAAAALQESVMVAVARALAAPGAWTEQPRATAVRRRLVRGAIEMLEASPAADWTLSNLSDALGVAPRTLHGAFAAVLGCSPSTFLKRRRLVLVRRALLRGDDAPLVKTAALDHGFWHLGHFARDYHAMFGEYPSETRRAPRPSAGAAG